MVILIKNGTIIDGTGSKGYKSDLLIEGNKIKEIGKDLVLSNAEIIDATNKVISPVSPTDNSLFILFVSALFCPNVSPSTILIF